MKKLSVDLKVPLNDLLQLQEVIESRKTVIMMNMHEWSVNNCWLALQYTDKELDKIVDLTNDELTEYHKKRYLSKHSGQQEYATHPLANIFPMVDSSLKWLCERGKNRKKAYNIEIYDGQIIDGRCRYEANRQNGLLLSADNIQRYSHSREYLLVNIFRKSTYLDIKTKFNGDRVKNICYHMVKNASLILSEYRSAFGDDDAVFEELYKNLHLAEATFNNLRLLMLEKNPLIIEKFLSGDIDMTNCRVISSYPEHELKRIINYTNDELYEYNHRRNEIEIHPLANIFPVCEETVEYYCEMIKSGTKPNPVVVYEGKIVDGRCRYEANRRSGSVTEMVEYTGERENLFSYIIANCGYLNVLKKNKNLCADDLLYMMYCNFDLIESECKSFSKRHSQRFFQYGEEIGISESSIGYLRFVIKKNNPHVLKNLSERRWNVIYCGMMAHYPVEEIERIKDFTNEEIHRYIFYDRKKVINFFVK